MVNNIHIQINRTVFYKVNKVSNPVPLKVTIYEPYDKLSRKFNRYTHVIQYPPKTDYKPKDYVLCLDDPNAWYYTYILYLYEPSKKIVSVDIFFQSNDTDKRYPLLFGFNYDNDPSVYYTYYYLRGVKYFTGSIGPRGLIEKGDLITKLIEERGLHVSESYNKFIIRVADKPNKSEVKYPNGGHNTKRITLRKSEPREYPNFVKYHHEINKLNNVESFYISFHQDTLFMNADRLSGKLKEVDVYYNKHDGNVPVVVVFKFVSRTKLYRFSDFYLDSPRQSKNISVLDLFDDVDLKTTLVDEYKRVRKQITFKLGSYQNEYISVTSERFFMNNRDVFRRAILRPNLDSSKDGDPRGPYVVYNDNLFHRYSNKIIDSDVLRDLANQEYGSIYVYYTGKNDPLLVGFIGDSVNKFVRIGKGGKSWLRDADNINIYHLGTLFSKLSHIEKERNQQDPGESGKVSIPSPEHPKTSEARPTTPQPPPSSRRPSTTPSHRIPEVPKEREEIKVEIDLSKITGSDYGSGKVKLFTEDFGECGLFCYYIHTPVKPYDKISFVNGKDSTFTLSDLQVTKLHSVSVYYNRDYLTKPLIMKINAQNGDKYYGDLVKKGNNIPINEYRIIGSNLCEKLIEENDKVNSTNTYQIEMTTTKTSPITYGYNKRISLTVEVKESHGYSTYTHKPSGRESFKGYVLFNKKVLFELSDNRKTFNSIQNKTYKEIKAYFLNNEPNLPLMVELSEATITSYYGKIVDKTEEHWKKLSLSSVNDDSIQSNLIEINYSLKSSVIIEIDKKHSNAKEKFIYDMKMISNKRTSSGQYESIQYEKFTTLDSTNVEVSASNNLFDSSSKSYSQFNYVSHELKDSNSESFNRRNITGVRLFITKGVGTKPEEIFFYESQDNVNDAKKRLIFYYPPKNASNKITVFFHGDDPRPLLVCYNGQGYKRLKNTDNTKWIRVSSITKCFNDPKILATLNDIYKTIAKEFVFRKDGNDQVNVKKSSTKPFDNIIKDSFVAEVSKKGPLKLSKKLLIPEKTDFSNINELLDDLYEGSFGSINVYKTGTNNTLKEVLLYEFISESRTIHLQRKDAEANYWVIEKINYADAKSLQTQLLSIQSKADNTIFFEIDQKDNKYNSYISLKSNWLEISHTYIKYTHSPESSYTNRVGHFLYKGQRLMVKKSPRNFVPFETIKNDQYTEVSVYYGAKTHDIPLIIELTLSKTSSSKTYYKHMKYETTFYWEAIQTTSSFLDTEKLTNELKQVEFNLIESVIILMDIKKNKYGETQINQAIPKLTNKKEIYTYPMDDECIFVSDKTSETDNKCIAASGYVVFEHNINNCVKEKNPTCSIRFFIPSIGGSNKYSELTLYDGRSLETLFYSKPYGDSKIYIYYYYGTKNRSSHIEDNDPRPLLIFYGNRAYRPMKLAEYFDKWYKDPNLSDFSCQGPRGNPDLTRALSTVVGFLNEVHLENRPKDTYVWEPNTFGREIITYDLQTYNNDVIKIQVSYHNGSCFRSYKHEPYGVHGPGQGFRLGNIFYDRKQGEGLNYEISKQLRAVSVYYFVYDYSHNYPLFISLEFKEGSNDEYYELDDPRDKKWRRVTESVDKSNIEYAIKAVIKKLKIEFDTGERAQTLFYSTECYDDNNKTTIIAAASGGTVTTAALVGGGVTAVVRPEWFIPVIRALV